MGPTRSKYLQVEQLLTWADSSPEAETGPARMMRKAARLLLITITQFKANNISLRSGALTYTILLSLVPMLAMSTAVVKGLGGGDHLRELAYSYIETLDKDRGPATVGGGASESDGETVPAPANLTSHLRSAIDRLFDYVDNTNFAALGTFGVAGMFFSVILVLGHIEAAMNSIWKVSAGRPFLRKIADYFTLLLLLPLSINLAFAASAFLESPTLAAWMGAFIPAPWIRTLLLKPVPVLFIALSFHVLYIFFTNTKVKNIPAACGALFAAILWFAMQNLYINLQVGVAKYNAIYGSFATLPLFLVWIYLGWMFILTGAQLAFACQHLDSHRLLQEDKSLPSFRLAAAFDIMDQVYGAFAGKTRVLHSQIIDNQLSYYPAPLLTEMLEILEQTGFIHISRTDGRILPELLREEFSEQKLVEAILGTQSPQTPGGQKSLETIRATTAGNRKTG